MARETSVFVADWISTCVEFMQLKLKLPVFVGRPSVKRPQKILSENSWGQDWRPKESCPRQSYHQDKCVRFLIKAISRRLTGVPAGSPPRPGAASSNFMALEVAMLINRGSDKTVIISWGVITGLA